MSILESVNNLIQEVEAETSKMDKREDKKESFVSRHKGKLLAAGALAAAAGAGYAGYKGHLGKDIQQKIGKGLIKASAKGVELTGKGTAKANELAGKAVYKLGSGMEKIQKDTKLSPEEAINATGWPDKARESLKQVADSLKSKIK